MKILRLDHFVITVKNVEKTVDFYTTVLGMEKEERNGHLAFRFGNQKINVHRQKAEFLPAAKNVTYGSADICLIAEGKIEAILCELKEKNVKLEEPNIVNRNGACGPMKSVYIRDPDLNLIEISSYC